MTQPNLVALAQQGDPRAIAALVNQHLQPQGIQGRVTVKTGSLHLLLESDAVPDRTTQLEQIAHLFLENDIHAFETVMVYGRKQGDKQPAWQDKVDLSASVSPTPALSDPDTLLQHDIAIPAASDEAEVSPLDLSDRAASEPLGESLGEGWRDGSDTNGSGAGPSAAEIPADFAAFRLGRENEQDDEFGDLADNYTDDIEGLEATDEDAAIADETEDLETEATAQPWYVRKLGLIIGGLVLVVVASLGIRFWLNQQSAPGESPLPVASPPASPAASPPASPASPSPSPVASPSPASPASPPAVSPVADPFREAVNRATSAAQLTQTAKTRQEWETVAAQWREAIALMQAVPVDSPNYATAQDRAGAYQKNLAYAERVAASRPQ